MRTAFERAPGFLAGLRDDAVTFLVDAPRLLDLLGDRHAQLVDEVEHRCLLEDDLARHWELATVDDQRLQTFDQELYVHVILRQRSQTSRSTQRLSLVVTHRFGFRSSPP